MRAAYSHEVISHGFWPGGDWPAAGRVEEPIFYAYAVPEPDGFPSVRAEPDDAHYDGVLHEFVLPYAAVRQSSDPENVLTRFLESTYRAAAEGARWPRDELEAAVAAQGLSV
jgi:hypothetical protein